MENAIKLLFTDRHREHCIYIENPKKCTSVNHYDQGVMCSDELSGSSYFKLITLCSTFVLAKLCLKIMQRPLIS